jgi:uncharacterized protein (DUF302 family)
MTRCLSLTLLLCIASPSLQAVEGMIDVASEHSVAETADRLRLVIEDRGMTMFARVDHAGGAASVGRAMRDTEVVIFGHPNVGSRLMECSRRVAIDLPQKALIWEKEDGSVWLTYNDPAYLQSRHGLEGCEETLKAMAKALATIAEEAAR